MLHAILNHYASERRPLIHFNQGIFSNSLVQNKILPRQDVEPGPNGLIAPLHFPVTKIPRATASAATRAITEVYLRIQKRFESYFDMAGFEASVPQDRDFEERKFLYTFQEPGSDLYPPHLYMTPSILGHVKGALDLSQLFDFSRLLDTGSLLFQVIPDEVVNWAHHYPEGATIAAIEGRNRILLKEKKDIYTEPNIGERSDWYTDAVFAQQSFTGPNPVTIQAASNDWVGKFLEQAKAQSKDAMISVIKQGSLYLQDNSYYRAAVGSPPDAELKCENGTRYGCASVTLLQLTPQGKLHPLAIIIDYKGSIENSVTIFNKRLAPFDSIKSEENDWPWRYAKTCAQSSDWTRHELTVHLTNCHLVEEVVIIAAHRSFRRNHPVYKLLMPHWLKTLAINAGARSTLIPSFLVEINGITEPQTYAFIRHEYENFDWKANYVPTLLESRGFTPKDLTDSKFKNYAYGKDISLMWQVLHKFVSAVLKLFYHNDASVASDSSLATWISEMRGTSSGNMKTFPDLNTFDELVDAVVMCIHIASPQHTAVNYLQNYYQAFIPNKPAALYTPLPTTIAALEKYTEKDLIASLPVKYPREWLMATHIPYLLSMQVAEQETLFEYALSVAKSTEGVEGAEQVSIKEAALQLYDDLVTLGRVFKAYSDGMDDKNVKYQVLDPERTAVSILI